MIIAPPAAEAGPTVAAGPFRAQLRFLINSGSVSTEVIAELAGLRHDQLRSLLAPPVRGADQIPAEVGRRLLTITAGTVRAARYELVPAGPVRAGLRRLLDAGWDLDRVTDYLRMRRSAVKLLLTEQTLSCTRLTQLRVAAAVRLLPRSESARSDAAPPERRQVEDRPALRPVA
jgi:hypothetical protein